MKETMVMLGIRMIMGFLTPDLLIKLIEKINEKVEAFVMGTEKTIDDALWAALQNGDTETLEELTDTVFDFCKDFVLGTASKLDDAIVLPFLEALRAAMKIPEYE